MRRSSVIRVDKTFVNYMEMRKQNYQLDTNKKVTMCEFSRIYPNMNTGNKVIFVKKRHGLIHL